MKVFMYCRGSKSSQVLTLTKQQQMIEARVGVKIDSGDIVSIDGYDLIPCIESGVSASRKFSNRPMGRKIMADSSPGDVIAVHKLDRIFRSVIDMSNTVALIEKMGLRLICCEPDLDIHAGTSAFNKFILQIMTAVAELERCMVSERTKHALEESLRRGTYKRGHAPLGWKKVKVGDSYTFHVDREERRIITEDIIPQLQQGVSASKIEHISRAYDKPVRPSTKAHYRGYNVSIMHWAATHGFPASQIYHQYTHLVKPAWTTNLRGRPIAPAIGIDPDTGEPVTHTLKEQIEMFFNEERKSKIITRRDDAEAEPGST